jgi:uncharacterized protein
MSEITPWLTWAATAVLMAVGLVGAAVPFVPGPVLILLAAVAHALLLPGAGASWWTVGVLGLLVAAAYAVDVASGVIGAKWFGASKWGIGGAVVGGLTGLFFGPVGWVLGPLLGGLAAELFVAKRDMQASLRGTWGTVVGTGVGLAARLGIAIVMVAAFLMDVLVWN